MNEKYGVVLLAAFLFLGLGCQRREKEYEELMKPVLLSLQGQGTRIVDGEVEPPFPKDLGNKSIIGTDVNNNGIRDDVEIWINHNASSANERKAMKRFAYALTKKIDDAPLMDSHKAFQNAISADEAADCLQRVTNNLEVNSRNFKTIWKLVYYPSSREEVHSLHISLIAGKIVGIELSDPDEPFKYCKFSVSK